MTNAKFFGTLWRELRPSLWLVVLAITYAILRAIFTSQSETRGLLDPSGNMDQGFLILGLVVLVLRVVVLVGVPLVITYRVVKRVIVHVHAKRAH